MELHPAEAAWRRARKTPIGEWIRACEECESRGIFLRAGHAPWPAEVKIPVQSAQLVVSRLFGPAPEPEDSDGSWFAGWDASTFSAYRESKRIYLIESALVECLGRTAWPDRTPVAALALPTRFPVLDFVLRGRRRIVSAIYDYVWTQDVADPRIPRVLELWLTELYPEKGFWFPITPLNLHCDYLGTARDSAIAEINERRRKAGLPQNWKFGDDYPDGGELTGLILTLLLYIGGDPDIVQVVHPGARPAPAENSKSRAFRRWHELRDPETFAVGRTFTRAIERWEIERRNDPEVASGRTVRPHMRQAHTHLYWTGVGREVPRVKFLLPISVRGGKILEEPDEPVEISVR